METLSSLDRLLMSAAVGGMVVSLCAYAAARTATLWKAPFERFARASQSVQTALLAVVVCAVAAGGGKTNAPSARLPPHAAPEVPAQDLPVWFLALGYPAADADGSGIPDCWERWTHTRGFAADADPDGDGLSNREEFAAQTDPANADTDGDGLDDATELSGLAAGIADLDPLLPAVFAANEPDADGVPDVWEDSGLELYQGVDSDGLLLGLPFPVRSDSTFEAEITVSTTLAAELSVGGSGSLLLPPCSGTAFRVRFRADGIRAISLYAAPAGAEPPPGPWKAEIRTSWPAGTEQYSEDNRLLIPDGTAVDRSGSESIHVSASVPRPEVRAVAGRGGNRGGPSITFTARRLSLSQTGTYCPIHGSDVVFTIADTNAQPPYIWTEDGIETETQDRVYRPAGSHKVSVRWKDAHKRIFVDDYGSAEEVRCRPGRTNLVGAAWTSTHDPKNPSDHAPGVTTNALAFGPLCPPAEDVDVRLGWTHDTALLHIRNLVRVLSGDAAYDDADHCIGIEWKKGGIVNLGDYVSAESIPFLDRVGFMVNGHPCDITFSLGKRPPSVLYPKIYVVSMIYGDTKKTLDTFVLTAYDPAEADSFARWKTEFADIEWTSNLPRPPRHEPSSSSTSWYRPSTPGAYMHHNAVHDMRSKPVTGGHGHQATYDSHGLLISDGTIASGTADYVSPESILDGSIQSHRNKDVRPFFQSLHLDGNPGHPDNMTGLATAIIPSSLTHPCIFQGENMDAYISRRPTLPTGADENE